MTGRPRRLLSLLGCLLVGVLIGGYLFSRTQPRSILALNQCTQCLSPADLAGMLASVGIQRAPGLMPFVAYETDKTIAIKDPLSWRPIHYVIIPKKDIKDLAQISPGDSAYLLDAVLVARHLIEKGRMRKYRFHTNGPGLQSVTYLHFHLDEVEPDH